MYSISGRSAAPSEKSFEGEGCFEGAATRFWKPSHPARLKITFMFKLHHCDAQLVS